MYFSMILNVLRVPLRMRWGYILTTYLEGLMTGDSCLEFALNKHGCATYNLIYMYGCFGYIQASRRGGGQKIDGEWENFRKIKGSHQPERRKLDFERVEGEMKKKRNW